LRVFLVGLAAAAGMLVAGHCAAADAQAYSAYFDPGKTALSFVLSKGENVAELQREFGLADEEVGSILAAINEENEARAGVRAEREDRRFQQVPLGRQDLI
jgi:hypothetical protein